MRKDIVELARLLDCYGDLLTEKQRDYLEQYSQSDLSLAEIAENEGITRQGVRDVVTRAAAILREQERAVGVLARYGSVRARAERLLVLSEEIAAVNERRFDSAEIRAAAAEIRSIAQRLAGETGDQDSAR